jgi:hypothetical protein
MTFLEVIETLCSWMLWQLWKLELVLIKLFDQYSNSIYNSR